MYLTYKAAPKSMSQKLIAMLCGRWRSTCYSLSPRLLVRHLLSDDACTVAMETKSQKQCLPLPDADTCISLIKQCHTLRSLKSLHASMIRSYLHLNLFFSTKLVARYAFLCSLTHASTLFSLLPSSDVFLWNVMIRAFLDNHLPHSSLALYTQMRQSSIPPDHFTFPSLLKACANLRDLQLALKLHAHVFIAGFHTHLPVANSLLFTYAKCGSPQLARQLFDLMPHKNAVSWSSMIGVYAQDRCYRDGFSIFFRMLTENITPSRVTILNALACVTRKWEADVVLRVARDTQVEFDNSLQTAAMAMYARCCRMDIARSFFDGLTVKDLVSWTSMIEAYSQADMPLEALTLFRQMLAQGNLPDSVALLCVIRACSDLAIFQQARFVHCYVIRHFATNLVVLKTALLDFYVKCGSLAYARNIFDQMQIRSIITWSTMIAGCGLHGHAREALHLFKEMKASTKPDQITFTSVLSACSHGGLINEGWECFNSMARDFGIAPGSEHYACMVDLLGRAGKLKEACDFIAKMPIKPNAGVWGALLGACRTHSNIEMAEIAAKHLFQLDPQNPGRYVILSNIYASLGKRNRANHVRAIMKEKGVRKVAGHSVIEVKSKVYTFVAGDRSHAEAALIYSELKKLMDRIRREGYIPDMDLVLHDVEEESKEEMLYAHSEKLAIVFGLLRLGEGSIIRINKNLRVCKDCHLATKYISKVTGREIIVRDAQRFHHFKAGLCSCGDYW